MENNLYYTPTIEEFHVGFEYEYNSSDKKHWTTCIIDKRDMTSSNIDWCAPNGIEDAFEQIETNGIRVKYLDQFDIESLGWEFKSEYIAYYKHKLYVHEFWGPPESRTEHKERYKLFFRKGEITISNDQIYDDYEKFFQGTIKNKSELIKLMQQLNIK